MLTKNKSFVFLDIIGNVLTKLRIYSNNKSVVTSYFIHYEVRTTLVKWLVTIARHHHADRLIT